MKKFAIALFALLPLTQAAAAGCGNTSTQLDMSQCAADEYKKVDGELNRLYQDVVKRLVIEEHRALLKSAQRKWIAYRDADCEFQTFPTTGGSIHGMLYSQCLTQKTAERVKEFKSMLSCKEGDLSCPL
ncbi:lysozyme inhibitor LprI family protein [Pectobacterium brasiliense]|uniref:lysozyme inhibitor LprI family protein n=1 Tax=Pectobacterium brasiliense TaxID=180957 RepID=UPI001968B45B|nr:lysozyme inhibitor LprI family protein [Pectobacterium brasiliense]MBN3265432.1 lysozyme inhibitor LprI family protein [Pectobacterium brasiliense]